MATDFKVVLDCADPHRTAAFWAAAMGYQVEDHAALVRSLMDQGRVPEAATVEVDGRLAFRTLAAIRHPDDAVQDFTGMGLGRRMLFQAVPEPKTIKNRMHLDLHVGGDAVDDEVRRLEGLGATVLARVDEDGSRHVTMADPEGSEFCVQ